MTPRAWRLRAAAGAALAAALLAVAGCASGGGEGATPSATETSAPPVGCLRADGGCLGIVPAGDYHSAIFNPYGTSEPGQLQYTLPDGWANALDHSYGFWLAPADVYESDPEGFTAGIAIWSDVATPDRDFPTCPEQPDPDGPTDAAGLAEHLAGLDSLAVTERPAETIDGRDVVVLDLELEASAAESCSWGPFEPVVASGADATDPYMWGIGEDERMRVRLVDLGKGRTLAVITDASPERFDALEADAEAIAASLRITS